MGLIKKVLLFVVMPCVLSISALSSSTPLPSLSNTTCLLLYIGVEYCKIIERAVLAVVTPDR